MGFLPRIKIKGRRSNNYKRSIKLLPPLGENTCKMTATTNTTTTVLQPKNKTGIYAGDTLQDIKPPRGQQPITVPTITSEKRPTGSANLSQYTRSSKNDNHHPNSIDQSPQTSNPFTLSVNGIRDGFRPSTVRRQRSRIATAISRRDTNSYDLKDTLSSKQSFTPAPASARLRSEIDYINTRIKIRRDLNKLLQSQNNQTVNETPQSALSYSTSLRLSSASTNPTTARLQKHFSPSVTNGTITAPVSVQGLYNTSSKSLQSISSIGAPTSPIHDDENNNPYDDTHAYQIPQQSNIGSESIFPVNSQPSTSIKSNPSNINQRYTRNKSTSCPFYVMYFTNLAMQQQEYDKTSVPMSPRTATTATSRKTMNSRISTSYSRSQLSRRQLHSPISMNTYSTIDDDDSVMNTTYYNNKRFSAKIAAYENENSHLLKDILRTTSWNHLQV